MMKLKNRFMSFPWRRRLLIVLAVMASVMMSLILCISFLVSTSAGSRMVMKSLAKSLEWQLGDMQGNLLTGLDISHIEKNGERKGDKQTTGFAADKISFRWQPLSLFYTALNVQSLKVAQLRVQLPESDNNVVEWAEKDWPSLAQPLRIELHHIEIDRLAINSPAATKHNLAKPNNTDEHIIWVEKIKGSLSLGTFHLRISPLQANWNQQHLVLNGAVGLRYPYDGELKYQITPTADTNTSGINASGNLQGDIKKFTVAATATTPIQLTATATIEPALQTQKQKPQASIGINLPQQAIPELLTSRITQGLDEQWNIPTTFQGKLEVTGWLQDHKLALQLQTAGEKTQLQINTHAHGQIANAQSLSWAVDKTQLLFSSVGAAKTNQPAGRVDLSGNIGFDNNEFQTDLKLSIDKLNIHALRANIESEISGRVHTTAAYLIDDKHSDNNSLKQLALDDMALSGTWQTFHMNASGNLALENPSGVAQWNLKPFNLHVGDNQLSLDGNIGNRSQLRWNLTAPKLQQLLPELGGSLQSRGELLGDIKQPKIIGQGELSQFVYNQLGMDKAVWSTTVNEKNFDVNFSANHWQWQDTRLAKLSVVGKGQLTNQQWQLAVESSSLGALQANWNAALVADNDNQSTWQGNWQRIELAPKKMPRWFLLTKQPFQLQWNKPTATANTNSVSPWQWTFGEMCLTTGTPKPQSLNRLLGELPQSAANTFINATTASMSQLASEAPPRLCLSAQQNSSAISANLQGDNIPLNQWQAWFKNDVIISGQLTARVDVNIPLVINGANKKVLTQEPVVTAKLSTTQAQLMYQFQGGETEVYPLKEGQVELVMKGTQGKLTSTLNWGEFGNVTGMLNWAGKEKKLDGNLQANLTDLAPLEALLPFLNDVTGNALIKLDVSGTAAHPLLTGRAELNNGTANIPKLGLELKDASLLMTSQADGSMQLDAQITSGDGTLMLRGDIAHFGQPNWEWQSNIFGANIRAVDQPELIANINPNFKIQANAQQINLTGSTEIPWARSLLKTLPATATRVSQDVTVVESKSLIKAGGNSRNWPFLCNFLIYFGDDVRFTGFGLDSLLTGKINVLKEVDRQALTTGFVAVGQGKYKAYGQELNIERGRLIFQGPYDDPGLDIRAVRVMENVSAGLDIGGTLQRPKSKVFSIPAASDSDAMALLLTGKTLSQSSQSDAYSILGAIGSLGMDSGSSMTADITRFFRLDELTVKSNKGLEQSALWMGKQITPKLFIRYMVGLFDQAFTLGMRYQINEKLRLEVESGKANSVDVIYTIER